MTTESRAGRPCLLDKKMVRKTITVPAELWSAAAEKAAKDGTNLSDMIRKLLMRHLATNGR